MALPTLSQRITLDVDTRKALAEWQRAMSQVGKQTERASKAASGGFGNIAKAAAAAASRTVSQVASAVKTATAKVAGAVAAVARQAGLPIAGLQAAFVKVGAAASAVVGRIGTFASGAAAAASRVGSAVGGVAAALSTVAGKAASAFGTVARHAGAAALAVGKIGGAVTLAVGIIGGFGIKTAGSLQQAEIGFTTMLGSAEAAQAHMKELSAFAAKSPFELSGVVSGSRQLQAMGFSAEEVIPTLTAVGDTVASMGGGTAQIEAVTRALGQMRAKGKVSAEEMLQLAEVGIPAWDLLAQATGQSTAEVQKLASEGKITSDVFIDAFTRMEGPLAKFAGGMEAQSKTLFGVLSTLKDEVQLGLGEMFTPVLPKITEGVQSLIGVMQDFFASTGDTFRSVVVSLVDILSALLPALAPILNAVGLALGGVFAGVIEGLQPLAAGLTSLVGAVGPALQSLGTTVGQVFAAIGPAIAGLLEHAAPVFEGLVGIIGRLSEVAAPVLNMFAAIGGAILDALAPVMPVLESLVGTVVSVFGDIASAVGPVLAELGGKLGELLGQLAGALGPVLETVIGAIGPVLSELLTAVMSVAGSLVDALMPAIGPLGDVLQTVAEAAGDILAAFAPLFPVVADLVAALAPLAGEILGVIAELVAAIVPPVADLAARISSALLKAVVSLVEAILPLVEVLADLLVAILPILDPLIALIGIILDAVGGGLATVIELVAGGLTKAFEGLGWIFERIAPVFEALWDGIVTAVSAAWEFLQPFFDWLGGVWDLIVQGAQKWWAISQTVWNGIWQVIQTVWAVVQPIFQAIWNVISGVLIPVFQTLWNKAKEVWEGIWQVIQTVWAVVQPIFAAVVGWIRDHLVARFQELRAVAQIVWAGIQQAISAAWNFVKPIFQAIWDWITGTLIPVFQTLWNKAKEVWEGIVNAAKGAFDGLKDAIKGGLNTAIRAINTFLGLVNKVAGAVGLELDLHIDEVKHGGGMFGAGGSGRAGRAGPMRPDEGVALLQRGEYVVRKTAVAQYGTDILDAINWGTFHQGGQVGQVGEALAAVGSTTGGLDLARIARYVGRLLRLERSGSDTLPVFHEGGLFEGVKNFVKSAGNAVRGWLLNTIPGLRELMNVAKGRLAGLAEGGGTGGFFGRLAGGYGIKAVDWLFGWLADVEAGAQSARRGSQQVVDLARKQVGKPYVWGATGPNAFDCSGLVSWAWSNAEGVRLPRVSHAQIAAVGALTRSDALETAGALMFRRSAGSPSGGHIFLSDGQGGQINAKGRAYGVVGGKADSSERQGIPSGFADGGLIPPGGGPRLAWLNETDSGEVVIPLPEWERTFVTRQDEAAARLDRLEQILAAKPAARGDLNMLVNGVMLTRESVKAFMDEADWQRRTRGW